MRISNFFSYQEICQKISNHEVDRWNRTSPFRFAQFTDNPKQLPNWLPDSGPLKLILEGGLANPSSQTPLLSLPPSVFSSSLQNPTSTHRSDVRRWETETFSPGKCHRWSLDLASARCWPGIVGDFWAPMRQLTLTRSRSSHPSLSFPNSRRHRRRRSRFLLPRGRDRGNSSSTASLRLWPALLPPLVMPPTVLMLRIAF